MKIPSSKIDGKEVSNEEFDRFLATLKIKPGTQINGESPKGLYTSYQAEDPQKNPYRVTIDGSDRAISRFPRGP